MKRRIFGLIGAASAALLLQAAPALADPPPHAKAWGYRDGYARDARYYGDRDDYRRYDRDDYGRYDRDDYRHHDRDCDHDGDRGRYYYPRPVYYVPHLPRGYRMVQYRGLPHYYYRNVWYAPYGGRYGVINTPRGVVVDARGVHAYRN
jgi:hypothetical protein